MEMLWEVRSHPKPLQRDRQDTTAEDAALMRRIAAADRAAMHILFLKHHVAVFRFVLQRLRDRTLAEDVTSDIFLDVWRCAGQFEGRSKVRTWMLTIARRKIFAARLMPHSIELDYDIVGDDEDPDAPLQAHDRRTILRKCITKLSAEHREVIDLVYYQEQSMESVATILGIPRNTAKTRVFYARKRLADELKKSGVDWVAI
jgi:RNA polymerase sigma-70 factor (ECF subfamily)